MPLFFFFTIYSFLPQCYLNTTWLFSCACCGRNYWHGLQSEFSCPWSGSSLINSLYSGMSIWLHESDLSVTPPAQWVRFMNSLFFPCLLFKPPPSLTSCPPGFPDPLFTPSCFPRCPGFPVPRSPSSPPISEAASVLQCQSPRCFLVLPGQESFWERLLHRGLIGLCPHFLSK